MNALPSAFLFGAQNTFQSRPRVAPSPSHVKDSGMANGEISSKYDTTFNAMRSPLSLHTDENNPVNGRVGPPTHTFGAVTQTLEPTVDYLGTGYSLHWPSTLTSGISKATNASLQSHLSDSTAGDLLRPRSGADESYGVRRPYDIHKDQNAIEHIDFRVASSAAQSMYGENNFPQHHIVEGRTHKESENGYDDRVPRSVSSSIPSTPQLSQQHSSSSSRSPDTEYSQTHSLLPPSANGTVVTVDSHEVGRDEQPIPELMSIHLKEKSAALDTWARLPSRPDNDAEANALLR